MLATLGPVQLVCSLGTSRVILDASLDDLFRSFSGPAPPDEDPFDYYDTLALALVRRAPARKFLLGHLADRDARGWGER